MDNIHGGLSRTIDPKTAAETFYDAVIVGSGVSGSIVAKELSKQGFKVLIMEAGPGKDFSLEGYFEFRKNFFTNPSKDNNSPFLPNPNAPMPRSTDVNSLRPGEPNTNSYLVQNGPFVSDSSYSRVVGGTTMHFESKTPRMLPDDFKTRTLFGRGLDWPISYDELKPYYRKAENEMGVSGDVESQKFDYINPETGELERKPLYDEEYVYPMKAMPATYLDKCVSKHIDGTEVDIRGEKRSIQIRSFPQGRNGIPNEKYKKFNNGKIFVPQGAVSHHQAETGERCQGNTNCTPLCPVQAKYDARKTLAEALKNHSENEFLTDLLVHAVASKVVIDKDNGRVKEIDCKIYEDINSNGYETIKIKGKVFIIAANAIESARLMLASGLQCSNGLIGRNLMDHPFLLNWALLNENAGTYRGTICTSGISDLRSGHFRKHQAAFAMDIHNDGWGWATGAPYTNLIDIVENQNKFGKQLREELVKQLSRQLLMATMIELPAQHSNRITIDPNYKDHLDNPRPVLSFNIPDYTLEGASYARDFSKRLFQNLGAEDHTSYSPLNYGYVNYGGEGYELKGGNHLAGTHIMGSSSSNSVVNSKQKSWEHENLYLVGAGSMPSIGTSNTTLTVAALCFMSTESIISDINKYDA
ncbi:GMC family oxidoreductase [Aureibacter tunicatorum]|uniref:Choline dehydrogenase-like flavoprotein n=1 Tax=Aureibacter tunicatorum TaxID=866807 RepID=A0AAE3XMU2_9BACT|nr:GMC family oxidoreductase [Aureibacter tunicatorum]MDR6239390.1 choline dehydrogenase-like flavoprotein [Aureibacter tunicatorum]BDD04687.1 dehydrogenase [Aureibacter tunicatorum]